ncbi:AsmA-like C-terminal region-containing protein [Frigidibacter sp. MR17.24]|uniref:AsmA-like C-terminal region-containing protein n=1 Tax=Frigidibacter sp. MR17.24 TaxID=3127345 RepID=UPI003012B0C1
MGERDRAAGEAGPQGPREAAPALTRPGQGPEPSAPGPAETSGAAARPPRRPLRWLGRGLAVLALVVVLALAAGIGLVVLGGRAIPLPDWTLAQVTERVNARLAGAATLGVAAGEIVVDRNFHPRIRLDDVVLTSAQGRRIAELPDVRASFATGALLHGQVEPVSLTIPDARLDIRRLTDGSLELGFLASGFDGDGPAIRTPQDMARAVRQALATPLLSGLETVDLDGLDIRYDDRRARQVWTVSDGRLSLDQRGERLVFDLAFALDDGSGKPTPATADLNLWMDREGTGVAVTAEVRDVPSDTLAAQSPALAWLQVIDAPISGSFSTGIDVNDAILPVDGRLRLGRGALRPTEAATPVPFDLAQIVLRYLPETQMLDFRDINIESPALRAHGSARAWAKGMENGLPTAIAGQISVYDLWADPQGVFDEPVSFPGGMMDLKLNLAPFSLEVGQFALFDGTGGAISAEGRVGADDRGWTVGADMAINHIAHDRLIALWPVSLVTKTRDWLASNVTTGELHDVKAAIRIAPQTEAKVTLAYAFRGASVRVLDTLPPVEDGEGYATIVGRTHTLVIEKGHVTAPNGGAVEAAGSVVTVPDITRRPTPLDVTLVTDSTIPDALSLLDQPPLQLMTKAGRGIDLAQGRARARTHLAFTLVPHLDPDAVQFDVTADLTGVSSDTIVPERTIAADRLSLTASNAALRIAGDATIDGLPVRGAWEMPLKPEDPATKGASHLDGFVELSPRALSTFKIPLPEGSVTGTGQGQIRIDLAAGGAAPRFRLTSDLAGIGLSVPEVGWSKPAAPAGTLTVEGSLGTPPEVTALALSAPGLTVSDGAVTIKADGTLDAVRLGRVQLAGWFDGGVELRGRGAGKTPGVVITGGSANLAKATLGSSSGSGGASEAVPITVTLDRLQISDTIAMTALSGDFTTAGGFNGRFRGQVNGQGAVSGEVAPTRGNARPSVRLRSDDAGRILRATGIFSMAREGEMQLLLTPRGAASGNYDGQVAIRGLRIKDAPVMADLLSAVSVVGLLEQLSGDGILFTEVDSRFRISPERVEILQGSAMGASLGVSMDGVYGLVSRRLELRGVVSPVYLLNGVGALVSRRGEGLFGFNYTISGTADDPKVGVNPLSILTPGKFREIFRSAPPEVKK